MTDTMTTTEQSLSIIAPNSLQREEILTSGAIRFLTHVVDKFAHRIPELLNTRQDRQRQIDAGQLPDFLQETRSIRESEWTIQGIPTDLQEDRKSVV